MTSSTTPVPEVGQAVRVRNRLATVRAVEPYDTRTAQDRLNIVDVEYLDDFRYPEAEQLLWEVESTATVLGKTSLPRVLDPIRFQMDVQMDAQDKAHLAEVRIAPVIPSASSAYSPPLPDHTHEVAALLSKVQSEAVPLAQCIAEGLSLARKLGNVSLELFCRSELAG